MDAFDAARVVAAIDGDPDGVMTITMGQMFKVVAAVPDGRRLSAEHVSLPVDYVQTYSESDGTVNDVPTAMVFSDFVWALRWTRSIHPPLKDVLEIWSCTCESSEVAKTIFTLNYMNNGPAFSSTPCDPEEMAAIVSGRVSSVPEHEDGEFIRTRCPPRVRMSVPIGTRVARGVRLVELLHAIPGSRCGG